nr:MAG TPA: hypothetical protein [Caudoviricetes sp.]
MLALYGCGVERRRVVGRPRTPVPVCPASGLVLYKTPGYKL